jgi:predicted dehydrogenase/threonine dehydrogenase-like Zn-dependent dehydrogenase
MKQLLQSLSSGKTEVIQVPVPRPNFNQLLIKTSVSLISNGTERMLRQFGKANLISKIKQQPDKVKQVLGKVKTDGLISTIEAVKSKLFQPISLGYCNVGKVIDVGDGVTNFIVGDRVLSNGPHSEVVCVSKNLCVKIPELVSDEAASFAILGAIGLQGIRLAQPTLGESVVVLGLGVIGLLTVQLLRAQGCRVLAGDFDTTKLNLAKQFGAETVDLNKGEDIVSRAIIFSKSSGVDAVLITASTESSDPIRHAALMCRKRGRIVLVGVAGLNLAREDFYNKELSFMVSCSYGPGRYDTEYEEKGNDYPIGFVRWTAQRNIEAVLNMMSEGKVDVTSLINYKFQIESAEQAYQTLEAEKGTLGIILQYPQTSVIERKISLKNFSSLKSQSEKGVIVGFIGAGNYASRTLIPAFKKSRSCLHTIVSGYGVTAVVHGEKNGFKYASTDYEATLRESAINAIVIATRHNQHAQQIVQALEAGKHVFVEKPLVITEKELQLVQTVYLKTLQNFPGQKLMVGFNRRFAPHIIKAKELLDTMESSKYLVMTVNAGFLPSDHWTQDPQRGGGRLIGEGCHFIDLLRFLVGKKIFKAEVMNMSSKKNDISRNEDIVVSLKFVDGSLGTILYYANGNKQIPKERLEISVAGRVLQLDNFRKMIGYGWPGFKKISFWKQNKGHACAIEAWISAIESGDKNPIPFEEIVEVTQICITLSKRLN